MNRILTVDEIATVLDCSKGHAYNYQRFLRILFPKSAFKKNNPVKDEQKRLK
jgi:hypothetical protein